MYGDRSPPQPLAQLADIMLLSVLQMRLATAVNVYPVLASVFAFMEASQWLFAAAPRSLRLELARGLVYLALGVALPLFMSCVLEVGPVFPFGLVVGWFRSRHGLVYLGLVVTLPLSLPGGEI